MELTTACELLMGPAVALESCCMFYWPGFSDICHIRFMVLELDGILEFVFSNSAEILLYLQKIIYLIVSA